MINKLKNFIYNRVIKDNLLWSMALYKEGPDFNFDQDLKNCIKVFSTRVIRKHKNHNHTSADPFLFTEDDKLFVFYETQAIGGAGQIKVKVTEDLENFTEVSTVLKEDFHLSYPFVFKDDKNYFMIPESFSAGKVILYKFTDFPHKVEKHVELLQGNYVDSSVIHYNGLCYLFTTSESGLEIFYTSQIDKGELTAHPQNPICTDLKYSRNGGGPIMLGDNLYRIAQDCSDEYGKNIHIMKIKTLNTEHYEEHVYRENYFKKGNMHAFKGGHHLNVVDYKGDKLVSIDFKQSDYFLNKIINLIFKLT